VYRPVVDRQMSHAAAEASSNALTMPSTIAMMKLVETAGGYFTVHSFSSLAVHVTADMLTKAC